MKAKEIEWVEQTSYHWIATIAWLRLDIIFNEGIYKLIADVEILHSSTDFNTVQSKAQELINELGEAIYQ